jgi:molybdopterin molybdotransferase
LAVISEREAREKILEAVRPLPSRQAPLSRTLDCFAAENYFARLPLPAFNNSAMDGYAVMASSCRKGQRLRLTGEQPAGPDRKLRVCAGEAVRIFTGAPIPEGADAVVMQEDITREETEIVINVDVEPGEFIRQRGCDLAEGQKMLSKGDRIGAAAAGLLASQGFVEAMIGGEVKAAILSTGDELVSPGEKLEPGQIYESNSTLLSALARRSGAIVNSVEHCRDERQATIEAIQRGTKNDVLIISGGVSVGEHDLVNDALRTLGAQIEIWRVAIKPGKPFLFGRIEGAEPSPQSSPSKGEADAKAPGESEIAHHCCYVFGLPGNPVSGFVTFLQFVRPAILRMMGATELGLPQVAATLTADLGNDGDRAHYIRGRLERGNFTSIGRQESHALFGLSRSNSLLRLEVGESLKAGAIVQVQIWD